METVQLTLTAPDTYKELALLTCTNNKCVQSQLHEELKGVSCGENKIITLTQEQLTTLLGIQPLTTDTSFRSQVSSNQQTSTYEVHDAYTKNYEHPNAKDALILVPGIFGHKDTYKALTTEFAVLKQPWDIWTVYYDYNEPLDQLGKKFAGTIEEINNKQYKNIYISAHSYGGLVTQEALHYADVQRTQDETQYSALQKIRKVILVGTPNEGSPAAEVYKKLDLAILTKDVNEERFSLSDDTLRQLATGKTIPRVRSVQYEVITGTTPFSFTKTLFPDIKTKNDGIVTALSAQAVGGEKVDNLCRDYYETPLTHLELNDNALISKLVMRSINEYNSKQEKEETIAGYTNYYDVTINTCNPKAVYTLIGKPITREEAYDPTGCSCGNNVCGEGETESNCPLDCANIQRQSLTCTLIIPSIVYILVFLLTVFTITALLKTIFKKETRKTIIKGIILESILIILAGVQYFLCGSINTRTYIISAVLTVVLLLTIQKISATKTPSKTSTKAPNAEEYLEEKRRPYLFSIARKKYPTIKTQKSKQSKKGIHLSFFNRFKKKHEKEKIVKLLQKKKQETRRKKHEVRSKKKKVRGKK